jgi:hypothetical protein
LQRRGGPDTPYRRDECDSHHVHDRPSGHALHPRRNRQHAHRPLRGRVWPTPRAVESRREARYSRRGVCGCLPRPATCVQDPHCGVERIPRPSSCAGAIPGLLLVGREPTDCSRMVCVQGRYRLCDLAIPRLCAARGHDLGVCGLVRPKGSFTDRRGCSGCIPRKVDGVQHHRWIPRGWSVARQSPTLPTALLS